MTSRDPAGRQHRLAAPVTAARQAGGRHGETVSERKGVPLRLDRAVHDALARWAADQLRSTNAQIEFLLRRALADAARLPGYAGRMRPRGRPRSGKPARAARPARRDDQAG